MSASLDDRLAPNIDYTRRDYYLFEIIDVLKCPIMLEISDSPIIFTINVTTDVLSKSIVASNHNVTVVALRVVTHKINAASKTLVLVATSSTGMQCAICFSLVLQSKI